MEQKWLSNIKMKIKKRKVIRKSSIQLENPDFITRNHIPNITQTPQNQQNSGGFSGKTREVKIFKNGI